MDSSRKKLQYFDLIAKVGTHHCYQYILMILFFCYYFILGVVLSSLTFVFMNPQFDCVAIGIETTDCQSYVCENFNQGQLASLPLKNNYNTIATQFGPFYCDENISLGFYRSAQSIGSFIGLFFGVTAADNLSRSKILKIGSIILVIGSFFLYISNSMLIVCIMMFLVGFSIYPVCKIFHTIVSEQIDEALMKNFMSICLVTLNLAQLLVGPIFKGLNSWRKFILYCEVLPAIAFLILVLAIIQDSPKFLLKSGEQKAIQALNIIAKINRVSFRYQEGDLKEYIEQEKQYDHVKSQVSPLDLFRYSSLRIATITLSIGYLNVNFLYYGLSASSDKIGINSILNNFLLGMGSMIGVIVSFLIAGIVMRRYFGMFANFFSGICDMVIFFIIVPSSCEVCSENIAEVALMTMVAIITLAQNQILYLHLVEAFPVAVRSMGIGIPTLFGTVGVFCSQFIIISAFEVSLKFPFLIMAAFGFIGTLSYYLAPETLNEPLKEQIDEIRQEVELNEQKG